MSGGIRASRKRARTCALSEQCMCSRRSWVFGSVLDWVEPKTKTGSLEPVEYKRGKPKPDPMDEIQLCA